MRYYKPVRLKFGASSRRTQRGRTRYGRSKEKKFKMYDGSSAVNFYNPYKKRTVNLLRLVKIGGLGAIFLTWILLLVYLPYFQIHHVETTGLNLITKEEFEKAIDEKLPNIGHIIPGKNLLFVNTESLKADLLKKYRLASLQVFKILPNTLRFEVVEKNISAVMVSETDFSLIDSEAGLLKILFDRTIPETYSSSTVSTTLPIISRDELNLISNEYSNLPVIFYSSQNHEKLPAERLKNVIQAYESLRRGSGTYFKLLYAELLPDNEITFYTDKAFRILATSERQLDNQINAVWKLLKTVNPGEYIDVRIEDRVFWK